ncbi:hypothetical protein HDU85_006147 [Gaertneriomyces sp. JEL0708]|nr:hypothetical protein HDU85_006147 [Gaertneriomyces sp. JEL0708]
MTASNTGRTFHRFVQKHQDAYSQQHNDDRRIYIVCDWKSFDTTTKGSATALQLDVSDGEAAWNRTVRVDDLRRLLPQGMAESDYFATTHAALSGHPDSRGQETECHVRTTEFTAELSWYLIPNEGIRFSLGKITLTSVSHLNVKHTLMDWVDVLITHKETETDHVKQLKDKVDNLRQQKEELLKEQNHWVTKKQEVEKMQFRKFKLVLNTKKAKIRDLMDANKRFADEIMAVRREMEELTEAQKKEMEARRISEQPGTTSARAMSTINVDIGGEKDNWAGEATPRPSKGSRATSVVVEATEKSDSPPRSPLRSNTAGASPNASLKRPPVDSDESDDGPPSLLGQFGMVQTKPTVKRRRTGTTTPQEQTQIQAPERTRRQRTPPITSNRSNNHGKSRSRTTSAAEATADDLLADL